MEPTLQPAWQLFRLRRYVQSRDEVMRFLAHTPQSAEAHCLLALIHSQESCHAEALQAASTGIGLSPQWDYPYYVHALVANTMGDEPTASKSLGEAIRLNPTYVANYDLAACILFKQGNYLQSQQVALRGLELQPRHIGCLSRLGYALVETNEVEKAKATFQTILSIDPQNADALGYLGQFAVKEGNYDAAMPLLTQSLQENPHWVKVQDSWKEALRAQYPVYRRLVLIKQQMQDRYFWHIFATVAVIWVVLYFVLAEGSLVIRVGHGLLWGCVWTFITVGFLDVLVAVSLHMVGRVLILWNKELRRTITTQQWIRGVLIGGALLLIAFALIVLMSIVIDSRQ